MATAFNRNSIIRDYLVKDKLGVGSYGVIYKVLKRGEKHYSVLKQVSLFNMDKYEIQEVKNESKILASLNSNFIVRYYESFIENNMLYIVMEYCDGGDLCNFLNNQTKLGRMMSEERIWRFFIQISLGLAYIHYKKILHRDLKTLNIFLSKDDKLKIGDLGVAKVLSQTNFAKTFIGTPYYLSPEICEEKPYNEKSDVWALGCILYELATLKHPFNANNQGALILKILKGKYDPISSKDYSSELATMINLLLEKSYFIRPSMFEIIKHPTKSVGMIDHVVTTCIDINLHIHAVPFFRDMMGVDKIKEVKELEAPLSKKNSKVSKKSTDNLQKLNVKNLRLEINPTINSDSKRSIEDPSKKFIQMNLPSNYKKQLQIKKDKKAQINKQINSIKDNPPIGRSSSQNTNQVKILNILVNVNNTNHAPNIIPQNSAELSKDKSNNKSNSKNKDRKTPIRAVKREDSFKKENLNNHPNNPVTNSNNKEKHQLKVNEVYLKMNEFDAKLENDQINPNKSNEQKAQPKRPQSSLEKDNLEINKNQKQEDNNLLKRNDSICSQDLIDEYIKYNINKKILENPNIANVEKSKMVIPRPDKITKQESKDFKCTNLFLDDDKRRTEFFKDLNLKDSNFDNTEISKFVDDLLKKSNLDCNLSTIFSDKNFNNKASISDFLTKTKDDNSTIENLNPYLDSIMKELKAYQQNKEKVQALEAEDQKLERMQSRAKSRKLSKKQSKNEDYEIIPSIPLYKKDMNFDFSVCYVNDNSMQDGPTKNNSENLETNSLENNTFIHKNSNSVIVKDFMDSYDDNSYDYYDEEEEEEEDDYYEGDEEAVEVVKNFRNSENIEKGPEDSTIDKDKNKAKELSELKEQFSKKIEFHKNELKKIAGEVEFNKIYQVYQNEENPENIDEISQKIDKLIRSSIPHTYENVNIIF